VFPPDLFTARSYPLTPQSGYRVVPSPVQSGNIYSLVSAITASSYRGVMYFWLKHTCRGLLGMLSCQNSKSIENCNCLGMPALVGVANAGIGESCTPWT